MRKLAIIACMLGACMATQVQATYDGRLKIEAGTYRGGDGGEFDVTIQTRVGDGGGLPTSFTTWCIEKNEYITLGSTYYYEVSSAAVEGGSDGPTPDPISKGSAYLYWLYTTGFVDSSYKVDSDDEAGDFQDAIWWLEQELASVNNKYTQLAITKFTDEEGAKADSGGLYGVVAVNLYGKYENGTLKDYKQSQLGIVVPEPGTWIAGLFLSVPFALNGYRMLRRKNA
ncbi:MAG TPA: hypothetical protein P5186_06430 [Candidatus Paceibacterota bacterium]|nr:hypothetical protein [Candidatus Paceibacterota bacterium]